MPTLPLIRATTLAVATLLLLRAQVQAQALPAACSQAATPIGQVQGTGDTSPLAGSTVTVQGVVVGDFEGPTGTLRGFYLQSLVGDGNPLTSEGIFVFNGSGNNKVVPGQVVRVTGAVAEFQGQTQISTSDAAIVDCGTGSVAPTDVLLPFGDAATAERYEGMLVRLPQTLFVTEHFQLGRFGQVVLSVNGRQAQPTNVWRRALPPWRWRPATSWAASSWTTAHRRRTPTPSCGAAAACRCRRATPCAAVTAPAASSA